MKIKKSTIMALIVFAISVIFLCIPVEASQLIHESELTPVYVISSIGLNIRTTPGIEVEQIATVPFATQLNKIKSSKTPGWTMIEYNNQICYVCNDFITHDKEKLKEVQGVNYYGPCTITHYCNGVCCCGPWAGGNCASGVKPTAQHTVAHNYLPFGTKVLIDGVIYTVEDRGDANMASGMWFDIYVNSHGQADSNGMHTSDVWIIE